MTPETRMQGVITAIHRAGLDAELWPNALADITALVGGVGCTVEVLDRKSFLHREFHSHGIPKLQEDEYFAEYAALSPRIAGSLPLRPGEMFWDYHALDEAAIDRSPFYADFLARFDMRYCVAGILNTGSSEFGDFAVQRCARQGPGEVREIRLIAALLPHVSRAMDVTRRLRVAIDRHRALEDALDQLVEGVVLTDAAGHVVHANSAFGRIAREADGVAVERGALIFADAGARRRFDRARGAILRATVGDSGASGADFAVPRRSGAPAYRVALRPLAGRSGKAGGSGWMLILIRDPLFARQAGAGLLREAFGLTRAEAGLACALQNGMTTEAYAREHGLSLNTVYTHLRRVKEKVGCRRMGELVLRLNALQTP